jgi:peptidoglycan/LPS O-acetylase OafA/YrhL
MPPARINAGTALVGLGAVVLLMGLFMDWYEPGVTAWTVFELIDLLLALLAVAALVGVAGAAGLLGRAVDPRWLLGISIAALVLVAEPMINNPPAVIGASLDGGAWVSLGGAIAMLVGAVLSTNRVSVVISFAPRDGATVVDDERDDPEPETTRLPTTPGQSG